MKLRILILLLIAGPYSTAAHAEDEVRFGRLFMEPKTREQLDESRKQNTDDRRLPVVEETADAEITVLKMDGVVLRGDGSTEVWVNGERSDSPQLTIRRSGGNRYRVLLPGGGEVTLKPGQVYSFESRRVLEGYEAVRELAAERNSAEAADATPDPAAGVDVKTGPATVQETKAAPALRAEPAAGFDEDGLAEQDLQIRLQDEGTKPEQANGVGN